MFTDVVTVKPGNQPVLCTVIIYIGFDGIIVGYSHDDNTIPVLHV